MTADRAKAWETLFGRAMAALEAAFRAGVPADDWSFGGGTVLMLKHRHRISQDIDIFVPDPQYLAYVSPRLNDAADRDCRGYDEQTLYVKIYYPEGEVDFVVGSPLTSKPFARETILGRTVKVETPLEIVGKKIWFRAGELKARDLFDLALVLETSPENAAELGSLLAARRDALQQRFERHMPDLEEDFAAIDTLGYRPSFAHCLALLEKHAGLKF